jgi:predicted nuclease of predicted toxin-antitoxin system
MKFLVDENIPAPVIAHLAKTYNTKAIVECLRGAKDQEIIQLANQENRIIITLDKDFCNLVFRKNFPTRGIILLRLHHESPQNIIKALANLFQRKEINLENNFVVVSDREIRVRPLKFK